MTEKLTSGQFIQAKFLKKPYRVHALLFAFYIVCGFIWASPAEIAEGMRIIFTSSNILVTDYIYIAGLGATMVNVGVMGLIACSVMGAARHRPFGLDMGVLGLVTGFAFFGKNPVNMFPIILGGILWAIFSCDSIKTVINPVLMGTTLAPAVSQAARIPEMPPWGVLGIALAVGLLIGFFITPISIFLRKIQEGYNLYPVGFAAGIMALFIMGFYRNRGLDFPV